MGERQRGRQGRTSSPSWCNDSISPRKRLRMPDTCENGLGSTNTITLRFLAGSSVLTALALRVVALDRTVRLRNAGRSATSTVRRLGSSCTRRTTRSRGELLALRLPDWSDEDLRMSPHCTAVGTESLAETGEGVGGGCGAASP